MNKIQCEVCGSNALTKKDGVFQCDDCGTKYTLEEMRKLLNGSSAPVQAVKPNNDSDFAIHAGELQHYYGASPNVVIPEGVRVILCRMRGLETSRFSKLKPKQCKFRRTVTMHFEDHTDDLRTWANTLDRREFNRKLEDFYNQE